MKLVLYPLNFQKTTVVYTVSSNQDIGVTLHDFLYVINNIV